MGSDGFESKKLGGPPSGAGPNRLGPGEFAGSGERDLAEITHQQAGAGEQQGFREEDRADGNPEREHVSHRHSRLAVQHVVRNAL